MKKKTVTVISVITQAILIFAILFGISLADDVANKENLLSPSLPRSIPNIKDIKILDLKTAGQIALSKSPSIAAASARILQAREYVQQARAMYWPKIAADLSMSKAWLSNSEYDASLNTARAFNPNASIDDPQDYFKTGLTIGWNIFDGFQSKFSNKSAKFGQNISEMSENDIKRLLLSSVADAYFFAQLSNENIGIAKANESFYKRQFEEAKIRRQVGTGSLSDELNFEIRCNDAKITSINATKTYNTALFSIAALLGINDSQSLQNKKLAKLKYDTPANLHSINGQTLVEYAMKNRADILQQLFSVKQAGANINIAKADYYPKLNLIASLDGVRTGNSHFKGDDFGYSIALTVSYDIFSGGLRKAKVGQAKAVLSEIKSNLKKSRQDISAKIHSYLSELKFIKEELEIVRSTLTLVKKQRDLVELEYNAGQCSLVRLNEAQRDLITAQGSLSLSLVTLNQTWYKLEAETGKILSAFTD